MSGRAPAVADHFQKWRAKCSLSTCVTGCWYWYFNEFPELRYFHLVPRFTVQIIFLKNKNIIFWNLQQHSSCFCMISSKPLPTSIYDGHSCASAIGLRYFAANVVWLRSIDSRVLVALIVFLSGRIIVEYWIFISVSYFGCYDTSDSRRSAYLRLWLVRKHGSTANLYQICTPATYLICSSHSMLFLISHTNISTGYFRPH